MSGATNDVIISQTIDDVRTKLSIAKSEGLRIGVVPTMGFLHEGHLSLVDQCRDHTDFIVVTIFVNPTQFGPNEDLDSYPTDFERDKELLVERGADLIFAPSASEIYPGDSSIKFEINGLAQHLCGASRPGHFEGVIQVVAKLFNIIQPDVAVFGQKDLQQLVIIKRMTDELNFPVDIKAGATIRESDGLAMSSRNSYLSDAEQSESLVLYKALQEAKTLIESGERSSAEILKSMQDLISSSSTGKIDYIEIVNLKTLQPVEVVEGKIGIALAVFVGKARLIDNIVLNIEGDHVHEVTSIY